MGTHVVHRDGSMDISSNRTVCASSSSSSQHCYVDNPYNRELGRIGKPVGTHVVHRDGSIDISSNRTVCASSSSSSQRCYVDNPYNRELGRVGKPVGTHVVHRDGSIDISRDTTILPRRNVSLKGTNSDDRTVYVSGYTRSNGTYAAGYTRSRPGTSSGGQRCYVDNAYNRKLGRVGKPIGTHVVHSDGSVEVSGVTHSGERCYIDNAHNRHLGRVGKPVPRRRQQQIMEESTLHDIVQRLQHLGFADACRPDYQSALDRLERERIEEIWRREGINPSTDLSRFKRRVREIIAFDELQLKQVIGRGGFGEVYACTWRNTPVAFKKLFYQNMSRKHRERLLTEIKVLSALDHPNAIKMFGVVLEEQKIGIVMEYMSRSLFQAIFIDCTEFSEAKKKEIIGQVASALLYLHTHETKIAHCDIKSENILLDKNDIAKLGDFGLSAIKNATETSKSSVAAQPGQGTPRYSAPEVLRGELLTISQLLPADIYSLAVVVFEVVTEEEPFEGLRIRQLVENVGRGNLRPTSRVALSQGLSDLLKSCWDASASKRPTAAEFHAQWKDTPNLYNQSK